MKVLRWFANKIRGGKKGFVIDNSSELKGVKVAETKNINVDMFSDYKSLLYKLNKKKNCGYQYGLIYENGSKYKPQIICSFIRKIDPSIKLIIYKNEEDLSNQLTWG